MDRAAGCTGTATGYGKDTKGTGPACTGWPDTDRERTGWPDCRRGRRDCHRWEPQAWPAAVAGSKASAWASSSDRSGMEGTDWEHPQRLERLERPERPKAALAAALRAPWLRHPCSVAAVGLVPPDRFLNTSPSLVHHIRRQTKTGLINSTLSSYFQPRNETNETSLPTSVYLIL